jgi:hypothetical protein
MCPENVSVLDKQVYTISAQEVIDLAKKYNSKYEVSFNTIVYVIPQTAMKHVIENQKGANMTKA